VRKEAEATAKLAGALARGEDPPAGLLDESTLQGSRKLPTVLVEPEALTASDLKS